MGIEVHHIVAVAQRCSVPTSCLSETVRAAAAVETLHASFVRKFLNTLIALLLWSISGLTLIVLTDGRCKLDSPKINGSLLRSILSLPSRFDLAVNLHIAARQITRRVQKV